MNLNNNEELTLSQQAQLKSYIDRLNELYPQLNVSLDENSGHVLMNGEEIGNNTEKIYDNIDALQKQAKVQAQVNAQKEFLDALGEATVAYSEQAYAMEVNKSKQRELQEQMKQLYDNTNGLENATLQEKYRFMELENQISALKIEYTDLDNAMTKNADSMIEAKQKYLELCQALEETGGLSEEVKSEFEQIVLRAEETGTEVPLAIANAMKDGAGIDEINAGIEYLAEHSTYNALLDDAKLNGELIPKNLVQGVMNDASSLTEAETVINNAISFQKMLEDAGVAGTELDANLVEAVLKGQVKLGDAANQTGSEFVNTLNDKFKEAETNTDGSIKKLEDTINDSDEFGAAATQSMDAYNKNLQIGLDIALSYVSQYGSSATNILSGIQADINATNSALSNAGKGGRPMLVNSASFAELPLNVQGLNAQAYTSSSFPSVGASVDVCLVLKTIQ